MVSIYGDDGRRMHSNSVGRAEIGSREISDMVVVIEAWETEQQ
jgi:hypothetical protein